MGQTGEKPDFVFTDPRCGEVAVYRSARRRDVLLLEAADGPVVVKMHLQASQEAAAEFVRRNTEWILRARSRLGARARRIPPLSFAEGSVFYYLGAPYTLVYSDRTAFTGDGRLLVAAHGEALAAAAVKKLYLASARMFLRNRTRELAAKHGFDYVSVRVNGAETRWGSCSGPGRLHFSWRLAMCPVEMVEYVIVHELAHTREMNHSAAFWQVVERCIPGYYELRERMNCESGKYRIW